jgi:hypothetical protein
MIFKLWLEAEEKSCTLSISEPNAKIPHYSFSLPSGFTCPFALNCLSKAEKETGKIRDFPTTDFRCFAASQESTFPSVRKSRWNNFEALKAIGTSNIDKMADAIQMSIETRLPRSEKTFRLHVGGDFFNESYLKAWMEVARRIPDIMFYTYTKSVPYIIKNTPLPENLRVTLSKGGKYDHLIEDLGLKFAAVVFSEEEAANYKWKDKEGNEHVGLEIDHDDSHAWKDDKPFALLIHGVQPAGSVASKALSKLKGKSSYGPATGGRLGKKKDS